MTIWISSWYVVYSELLSRADDVRKPPGTAIFGRFRRNHDEFLSLGGEGVHRLSQVGRYSKGFSLHLQRHGYPQRRRRRREVLKRSSGSEITAYTKLKDARCLFVPTMLACGYYRGGVDKTAIVIILNRLAPSLQEYGTMLHDHVLWYGMSLVCSIFSS